MVASNPDSKVPLCIFGPGGDFISIIPAGEEAEKSQEKILITPALMRLAAYIARGQLPLAAMKDLSAAAKAGVCLLIQRIAAMDRAILEMIETIPGSCPAQTYLLLGEIFAGGVKLALDKQKGGA